MTRRRILIVDDEELVRWSLRARLEHDGYVVVEAETAGQAPARWREGVDLVLLDLRLPDGDGLSLLKDLKHERPGCPAILMTAYGTPEVVRQARARGAHEVLGKPFDLDRMTALVAEALGSQPPP